jgi:hypothetical protein
MHGPAVLVLDLTAVTVGATSMSAWISVAVKARL